jgi:hypothetical protein
MVVQITRAKVRSSRASATDVVSKATDKKIVGKMTETQTRDPRTTGKVVDSVRLTMLKWFYADCAKTRIQTK